MTIIIPISVKLLLDRDWETKVCVNCSDTQRWYVRNIISGKTTYSEAEIIKDAELAKKLQKMDRRAGWGSNLYKV